MIYERVAPDAPIQQGDLFRCIPRVELSLSKIPIVDGLDTRQATWQEILQHPSLAEGAEGSRPIPAVFAVKPVLAIAITQNCDAVRARDICLCEVDTFLTVAGQREAPKNPDKWQSLIIRTAKANPKIFYLPAAPEFGIHDRMAADFRIVLRVPRVDLEAMRSEFRIAKLNAVANEHFRESLAHFFRRYAYNEWYPLTSDELSAYQEKCPEEVEAYPWQRPPPQPPPP
jgi:hypothetical protein